MIMFSLPSNGHVGPSLSSMLVGTGPSRGGKAPQACESCRVKKRRCDSGSPCAGCVESSVPCIYARRHYSRQDNVLETMMQQIKSNNTQLELLSKRLAAYEAKAGLLEQQQQRAPAVAIAAPTPLLRPLLEANHHTGSHNLFQRWPTVQQLLRLANVTLDETYVMEAEDGEERAASVATSFSNETIDNDPVELRYPTPVLSHLDAPTPAVQITVSHGDGRFDRRGSIKRDPDILDSLDDQTRRHLFASFIRNVQIMHPIVDLGHVDRLLDKFVADINGNNQFASWSIEEPDIDHDRPSKRRRLEGGPVLRSEIPRGQTAIKLQDSFENALCCLVLALGAICSSKEASPQPDECRTAGFPVNRQRSQSIVPSTPDVPLPANESYFVARTAASEPAQTPTWHDSGLSDASTRKPSSQYPGMEYYTMAKRIVGLHIEEEGLLQAQVFVLAGLYQGQVGKVKESMKWISMAGRTCLALLRRYGLLCSSDPNANVLELSTLMRRRMELPLHNLIVVTAWTCIQLEGDILAELPLPSSGLAAYEDSIPWLFRIPNGDIYYSLLPAPGIQSGQLSSLHVSMFYKSQLWLRKQLNQIQYQLYGDSCLNTSRDQLQAILQDHQSMLKSWRNRLPEMLRWNDGDPPSGDILSARLRAKYWGACFITNRPFLDYTLHVMPEVKNARDVRSAALAAANSQLRREAEIQFFEAMGAMPEATIYEASKRCVEAAVQSTQAFDGIRHQLIVTNIFGTAHAQFGNMLVLSATRLSPQGRNLLINVDLRSLLKRTIAFLGAHAHLSRTCNADYSILKRILQSLSPKLPQRIPIPTTTQSF